MVQAMAPVELFTTAICPYCVAAKNLLKQKGLEYSEVRIDQDPARRDEMLQRSGGRRTVPQIFVYGEHVGGFDDLVAADRSGKLAQIIEAATRN
jgi:glutaredoxin 3